MVAMTPGEKGQLAVKVVMIWSVLSVLFVLYAWPPLLRMIEAQRRRAMFERLEKHRRRAMVERQEKAYAQATRIIMNEEIARECAIYEEDLEREASAILARLDDEAKANFQAFARRSA